VVDYTCGDHHTVITQWKPDTLKGISCPEFDCKIEVRTFDSDALPTIKLITQVQPPKPWPNAYWVKGYWKRVEVEKLDFKDQSAVDAEEEEAERLSKQQSHDDMVYEQCRESGVQVPVNVLLLDEITRSSGLPESAFKGKDMAGDYRGVNP
jgi:hypothetical protein